MLKIRTFLSEKHILTGTYLTKNYYLAKGRSVTLNSHSKCLNCRLWKLHEKENNTVHIKYNTQTQINVL